MNSTEDETKIGRPTKYSEELKELAYKLSLLGLTDAEMSEVLGISERTFNNWKHDYPDFLQSVTRGKTIADAEVVASFRKKAVGYQYDEVHKELRDGEMVKTKIITKEVQPDAGAGLNWLKNRQPDKWRDKVEQGQPGELRINVVRTKTKDKS